MSLQTIDAKDVGLTTLPVLPQSTAEVADRTMIEDALTGRASAPIATSPPIRLQADMDEFQLRSAGGRSEPSANMWMPGAMNWDRRVVVAGRLDTVSVFDMKQTPNDKQNTQGLAVVGLDPRYQGAYTRQFKGSADGLQE